MKRSYQVSQPSNLSENNQNGHKDSFNRPMRAIDIKNLDIQSEKHELARPVNPKFEAYTAQIRANFQAFHDNSPSMKHSLGLSSSDIVDVSSKISQKRVYVIDGTSVSITNFLNKQDIQEYKIFEVVDGDTHLISIDLLTAQILTSKDDFVGIITKKYFSFCLLKLSSMGANAISVEEGRFRTAESILNKMDPLDATEESRLEGKLVKSLKVNEASAKKERQKQAVMRTRKGAKMPLETQEELEEDDEPITSDDVNGIEPEEA